MKILRIVVYVVAFIIFLGFLIEIENHGSAIKELEDHPNRTVMVDLTEKTIYTIANLEQEVDRLRLRVSELEEKVGGGSMPDDQ